MTVELVKALAWPITVLVLVLALLPLIRTRLTEFEGFGFKARFASLTEASARAADEASEPENGPGTARRPGTRVSTVPEVLWNRAEKDPTGAVVGAYESIANDLQNRLAEIDTSLSTEGQNALQLALSARNRGLISDASVEAVRGAATLRNLAAHGRGSVDTQQALEYLTLVDSILYSLTQRPARRSTKYRVLADGEVLGTNLSAAAAFRLAATKTVEKVGVQEVLDLFGEPVLSRGPAGVRRPSQARQVVEGLDIWHTSQLNQSDYENMVVDLSNIYPGNLQMTPED